MAYRGTVKGNVVALEPGADLPDGAIVTVEIESVAGTALLDLESDPFRMGQLAAETGIADLATNADHYLYGRPKVTDAG